ncbi:MAG: hypothetical protein NVS3B28_08860 [Candidatus Velthaea sp.]
MDDEHTDSASPGIAAPRLKASGLTGHVVTLDADGTIRGVQVPSDTPRAGQLERRDFGSSIYASLPEAAAQLRAAVSQAVAGIASAFEFERSVAGKRVVFEVRVVGAGDRVVVLLDDVTEQHDALRRLAATTRARDVAETALALKESIGHLGSWDNHLITGRFIWSDEFYRLLGLEPGAVEATQELWRSFAHPDDDANAREAMERARETRQPYNFDRRIVRADGTVRWLQQQAEYLYDDGGNPVRIVGTSFDITARKEAEEQLIYLAHHDPLTGLANRTLLAAEIAASILTARRTERNLVVLFIDLDRFKNINDTLGHAVGDRFLCAVADRLRQFAGKADTVARIGGDEFVIVSLLERHEAPADFAHRMLRTFADHFRVDGSDLSSNASIGVSVYPQNGASADELLLNADTAMYSVKTRSGNGIAFFAATMRSETLERLAIERDLRCALALNELTAYYQPIVNVERDVVAVEALVRWHHPTRGLVEPARFISIAEETGLILPIGEFVLLQACAQVAAWRASSLPNLHLAVNVSGRQFQHESLVATVANTLARTGLDPQALELEITESVIMTNADANVSTLARLKALGVKISIDDFGTGYSSLSYLHWFPVDTLKIDKSFVCDVPSSRHAMAIIESIVNLAHTLRLQVVAEGVETEAQFRHLLDVGCDRFQGYHFARPSAARAFIERFASVVVRPS